MIRDKGAKALSEMMKVNTTITPLDLARVKEIERIEEKERVMNGCQGIRLEVKEQSH